MRYQRIDLNLLVALDALLSEQNVTRAAERMHMTQSAMSGVLSRLRDYFGDPLLVPMGRSMQLTARAETLIQPVRNIILQVDATLGVKPEFDPGSAKRHFRVIASDYVTQVLLAEALRRIAQVAPHLTFDVRPTHAGMGQDLDQGQADLLVTPAHLVLNDHPQAILFDDTYHVIACLQNRFVHDEINMEQYHAMGHVVYQDEQGSNPWFEQWYANAYGRTRRVEVVSHSYLLMPRFIIGTDRIATLQTRLAKQFVQAMPMHLLDAPMDTPRLTEVLQWHRFRDDDPGMRWVREQIIDIAKDLPPI